MKWLERKLGRYAIPNLSLVLALGQFAVFFLLQGSPALRDSLELNAQRVLQGEVHRLITFLFVPVDTGVIWLLFGLYIFYLMGTGLESYWGSFRYNLYLFVAWLATVVCSFFFPGEVTNGIWIGTSVFLGFAWVAPDFQLQMFFLFPIKVKWLALLTWIGIGAALIQGSWAERALILASISNFMIFFGRPVYLRLWSKQRQVGYRLREAREAGGIRHRCHICQVTEQDDPSLEFRYCSQCRGNPAYCENHIHTHEHIPEPQPDS